MCFSIKIPGKPASVIFFREASNILFKIKYIEPLPCFKRLNKYEYIHDDY